MSNRHPIARKPLPMQDAGNLARNVPRTTPLNSDALIVSIHDVSPQTLKECHRIVLGMAEAGVGQCSLLVVPDYHSTGKSLEHTMFLQWLEQRAAAGHEIVIHGYTHRREPRGDENLRDKLTTSVYTADEGEFFDLDRESAGQLLNKAREEFREAGFETEGFIAPAWLLGEEAEEAVREAGFAYTTRLRTIVDLQTHRVYDSQSLVWSTRSFWRRQASLAWNWVLFRGLAGNPLMRVSIHPPDVRHAPTWRQVQSLVREAMLDRVSLTYERFIMKQRAMAVAAGV